METGKVCDSHYLWLEDVKLRKENNKPSSKVKHSFIGKHVKNQVITYWFSFFLCAHAWKLCRAMYIKNIFFLNVFSKGIIQNNERAFKRDLLGTTDREMLHFRNLKKRNTLKWIHRNNLYCIRSSFKVLLTLHVLIYVCM